MADEWFERAKYAMISAPSSPASEAVIDTPGTVFHTECRTIAAVARFIVWMIAENDAAVFLDTAERDALSRWGADRYKCYREGATASIVLLTFERPTDAYGAFTLPAGFVVKTTKGTRVALDEDLDFGSSTLIATGLATSVLAGSDQNVDAGTLEVFESSPDDTSLTVTNTERAAGGNEGESDSDYLSRLRAQFLAAAKGTLEAIEIGALAVEKVREAAAYEQLDNFGHQTGVVALTIGDESGASNSELLALVDLSLREYRGAGIRVVSEGATVELQDISMELTWGTGQATPANDRAARQAVVAVVNRLRPNGAATAAEAPADAILDPAVIAHAAFTVRGLVKCNVLVPSGDVAPAHGGVIRTTFDRVTTT
jgi:uncharacterized phage protein gp47/JayE